MKGAPLRIRPFDAVKSMSGPVQKTSDNADYLSQLIKLIPGEVVSVYSAIRAYLVAADPKDATAGWWVGITIFCFLLTVASRTFATSDSKKGIPPEWPSVIVSCFSFLIWVYSLGDVFEKLGMWSKFSSGIILFMWTAAAPYLVKGLDLLFSKFR